MVSSEFISKIELLARRKKVFIVKANLSMRFVRCSQVHF